MHGRCILCDFRMFLHVELFQRTFARPCMSGRVFDDFDGELDMFLRSSLFDDFTLSLLD